MIGRPFPKASIEIKIKKGRKHYKKTHDAKIPQYFKKKRYNTLKLTETASSENITGWVSEFQLLILEKRITNRKSVKFIYHLQYFSWAVPLSFQHKTDDNYLPKLHVNTSFGISSNASRVKMQMHDVSVFTNIYIRVADQLRKAGNPGARYLTPGLSVNATFWKIFSKGKCFNVSTAVYTAGDIKRS